MQPAPTPRADRHAVLTRFWACQRRRPRLQAAATGPCWDWGASVSGRQRRLERRLPRRLWRSRWARRFPMAEPACWAISSRKARSGSRRISKRYPASSHHKDRVHTLAPRPTRGIGFNGGTGATKKRPACARRSAPVAPFGHTPTTTCRSVTIGQAIVKLAGQRRWSYQRSLQHPVNPATEDHRRSPEPPPFRHQAVGWQGWVALVRAGSVPPR
jgi:hypothetical protein